MRLHAAERPHRPLFLWLSLNAPHTPMQAPEAAVARFPASYPPETRTYLGMVESMDAAFGVFANDKHRSRGSVVGSI